MKVNLQFAAIVFEMETGLKVSEIRNRRDCNGRVVVITTDGQIFPDYKVF